MSPPAPTPPSMEDDHAVVASSTKSPNPSRNLGSYHVKKMERKAAARSTAEGSSTMYKAVFKALGFKRSTIKMNQIKPKNQGTGSRSAGKTVMSPEAIRAANNGTFKQRTFKGRVLPPTWFVMFRSGNHYDILAPDGQVFAGKRQAFEYFEKKFPREFSAAKRS